MPCTSTGVPVQWARARARGIVLDVAVSSKSRGVRKAKILDPGEKRIPAAELPDLFVSLIGRGLSVGDALKEVGRSRSWYESMRRRDDRFRMLVDSRRVDRFASPEALAELKAKDPRQLTFPEFSERYMKQRVFPHLQNVVDLMDRREPSWRHPSMTWMEGDPDLLVVNMPPEHCAVLSTPVLTANRGWITAGEVAEGDSLFDPEGYAHPVLQTWRPDEPVPTFDVEFDSGDVITTDAGHKWVVYPVFAGHVSRVTPRLMTTEQLATSGGRWRVPVASPLNTPDADLPIDPYLFGYWLGDGDCGSSRFAVGDEDIAAFRRQLDSLGESYRVNRDSRDRSWVVYVHDLRARLRATGMFRVHDRSIPDTYLAASREQRLALLQGLMDADGTITRKDSRARFVQHKEAMARSVYRLVASLGMKPHLKHYGDAWEVGFRTGQEPVFRLERKARRQLPHSGTSKSAHRTIRAVRPTGRSEMVQCITVLSAGNEYLIGDGLIPTRNAKTTTLTINYAVYRIVQDPSVRIIIVSKSQNMAKKMLTAIKNRLTHPQYADLIRDFAPSGGFAQASDAWTQEMIYVGSETRDVEQKDPTVQALGIGGQIYGARADLIIMDDCIDRKNMREFESQIEWVQSEVMSRTNEYGTLLVVGTRLGPQDLYSEMTSPTRYPDERSPWTYLAMPAVLEFAEKSQDWVTLWPRSDRPEAGARDEQPGPDGLFPKWDGPRLEKKRRRVTATVWARVYQQQQVAEDNVFKPEDVEGCILGSRRVGLIPAGMPGNREFGMAGLLVVAGLDPATEGHTAATVVGFDPRTFKRYVLDVRNVAHMRPDALRSMVYELTDRYGISEWVIERNGFQGFLVHDRELNRYLNERGCVVRPHFTGNIKHDEDFGVAAMSALFNGHKEGHNMIELPNPSSSEGVRALIDQLVMWQPKAGKRVKTDTVMSLWMAELACLARVQQLSAAAGTHRRNRFLSKKAKSMQRTYTMADLEAAGAGWR